MTAPLDIDDPMLLIPRVLDVFGTLKRLGFVRYKYQRSCIYRLLVKLHEHGVPVPSCRRNSTHVCFDLHITLNKDGFVTPHDQLVVRHGYPMLKHRRGRLQLKFQNNGTNEGRQLVDFTLDRHLRRFEGTLNALVTRLKTQPIAVDSLMDNADGLVMAEKPPHESLDALLTDILVDMANRDVGEKLYWNVESEDYEQDKPQVVSPKVNRRLASDNRHMFRHTGRK